MAKYFKIVPISPAIGGVEESETVTIQKADLMSLVGRYVTKLETQTTDKMCKCPWVAHPDDIELGAFQCRTCTHDRGAHNQTLLENGYTSCTVFNCECAEYRARRIRKVEVSLECPVHSREGFLLTFFDWITARPSGIELSPLDAQNIKNAIMSKFEPFKHSEEK